MHYHGLKHSHPGHTSGTPPTPWDCLNDKISMTTTVGHSLETSVIANTVPRKEEKGTISA